MLFGPLSQRTVDTVPGVASTAGLSWHGTIGGLAPSGDLLSKSTSGALDLGDLAFFHGRGHGRNDGAHADVSLVGHRRGSGVARL